MLLASDAEARMIKDEIEATQEQLRADRSVGNGLRVGGSFSNAAVGRTQQRVHELNAKLQVIKDGYATRWKIEQRRERPVIPDGDGGGT